MHIHIVGICGTFMGSLAVLAKALGYRVSGSDANVYPPMSTLLADSGIDVSEGYHPQHLRPTPDLVIIGNAVSRGNPLVETVLNEGLVYTSGPQWLSQYVLPNKWVFAVAGTHGKTTTSAMLAWILEQAGLQPGFLIGGVTRNFAGSARLGNKPFFVVEADEYDSAFFDKRSKFVHYRPQTAILNNLEFDHADIFDDLNAIEKQFHHLVRTVPANGLLISPHKDPAIETVLRMGCWTPRQQFALGLEHAECKQLAINGGVFWNVELGHSDGSEFEIVKYGQGSSGEVINRVAVRWQLQGIHNVKNAMAAVIAAHHVGVGMADAGAALGGFENVKRRMELRGEVEGVKVYDDFAHHPSAIDTTLNGLAASLTRESGVTRLIAVIEPRSNTMKMGIHQESLVKSCQSADMVIWHKAAGSQLDYGALVRDSKTPAYAFDEVEHIVTFLEENSLPGDHIVIMSNGSFGGIHDKLLKALNHGVPLLNSH